MVEQSNQKFVGPGLQVYGLSTPLKSFIGLLFLGGAAVFVTLVGFIEVAAADIFCDDVDWVAIEDGVTDSVGVNEVLRPDTPVKVYRQKFVFCKVKIQSVVSLSTFVPCRVWGKGSPNTWVLLHG